MRLQLCVLDNSYPVECTMDEAADVQRLARTIDEIARDFAGSPMALTDADILLRVALQLAAEVEARGREPDFCARLERLSRRIEQLGARFDAFSQDAD